MNLENLQSPPKKQWASSVFHQAIGSLPVSVLMAIGATWLCYRVLPAEAAPGLAGQIQAACLGGGLFSTGVGAVAFAKRSLDLTDAKITNNQSPNVSAPPLGGTDE